MMDTKTTLGLGLKQCRAAAVVRGILKEGTQEELSRLTKIARPTINFIESGSRPLSARHAVTLADTLQCSLDQLYGREDIEIKPRD